MIPVLTSPLLGTDIDRMVRTFFPESMFAGRSGLPRYPALNAWETDTSYVVEAEVPGLTMSDLEVTVQNNQLTIQGTRKDPAGDELTYRRRERPTGAFERELKLPTNLDPEGIEATLSNGLLTVVLPKAREVLPRKITVRGG